MNRSVHTINKWQAILLGFIFLVTLANTAQAAITVSLTAPGNNTVVAAPGSFTLTASTSVTQGAPITSVSFYAGATLLGTAVAPAGSAVPTLPAAAAVARAPINTTGITTYTLAWNNIPMGIYSLTAVATDKKGVTATSVPVTVIIDVPPTVSLIGPDSGTVLTAPASFTLSANASAPLGSIAKVEYYNGATLIGSATAAPYAVTWANVPYGSYSITAKATDNYGLSSSTPAITLISNQPPIASLITPATNAVSTAPASFSLSSNASDIDGSIAKVDYYASNGTTNTLIGSATAAPYNVTWSNVPVGSYSLTAIATDNYGAATTSSPVAIISNAPPTVSLTGPASNAVIAAPGSFSLSSNASDSDGSIAKVDYYASNGTTNALIGTATAAPYTVTWNNVAAGSYSLTAIATDNYGAATTSSPVAVISDTPPTVNLTSPATNAVSTAPASFTLTASASSTQSTIAQIDYYASNGSSNTLIGTATAAPYTVTWSNVAAGNYSLTAKATDGYGITNTSAAVNVIANAAPTVSLTSPTNNSNYTAPANITLTADAADSDGSITKVDFYNGTTLLGTATAAPYSYNWSHVSAGNYSLTAMATDNSGASTTSAAVNVTVNSGVAQVYYIHTDQLNTPREITATSGTVVWQWDNSDPFGNNAANENPGGAGQFNFPLRLPGQYFDRETNTHYNINRDYDPSIGRYIESDPIGLLGGINTYTYVLNNPIKYKDPNGLTLYWNQSTGDYLGVDNSTGNVYAEGTEYSGHGNGVNNPELESVRDIGPTPRGDWGVEGGKTNKPYAPTDESIRLIPYPNNNIWNTKRDPLSIFVHGKKTNETSRNSSKGCIILPLNVRRILLQKPGEIIRVY